MHGEAGIDGQHGRVGIRGRKGERGDAYPIRFPGIGLPGFDGPQGIKGETGIVG